VENFDPHSAVIDLKGETSVATFTLVATSQCYFAGGFFFVVAFFWFFLVCFIIIF